MIFNLERDQGLRKLFIFAISILCLVFMIICSSHSFAEDLTLSLSSTEGVPTQTVSLTLSLDYPGQARAVGFNLDIYYNTDTDVLENPTATEGSDFPAGKQMNVTHPSHPYFDVFRIIVFGNEDEIPSCGAGCEVVIINFDIKPDAPPGQTDLMLINLAASDPDAQPLVVLGNNGSITVEASAIPTLTEWGMIIFMTVILGIGVMILRKRRIA